MSNLLVQKRNKTCFQNEQGFSKANTAITLPTQPPPPPKKKTNGCQGIDGKDWKENCKC